jgi:Protein of unknown function (DUF1365)
MTAYMLTMPRFLGYAFNPLTTYYVFDSHLIAIVLEVHNTFGEKNIYVAPYSASKSHATIKRFHVSPFNDREGTYQFKAKTPEEGISIELVLVTPDKRVKFVATLESHDGVYCNNTIALLKTCILCGWWILMTMLRILKEAWKLHYLKRLPVYMRPEPFDEPGTTGRQSSSSQDLYFSEHSVSDGRYFKSLVLDYFKTQGENIEFRILAENTLIPEIIIVNKRMKKVTVLSNSFFTNFALGESVDGLYTSDGGLDVSQFGEYVQGLIWSKRIIFSYMRMKALMSIRMEKELFGRIATFAKGAKPKI